MPTTTPIRTSADYIASLRGRNLNVFLFGERIPEPVDHPIIRPSVNALAETYALAERDPELATAISPYTGQPVNRFLHIATTPADLVAQNHMQRRLGQLTGTCFQRCVGMDALNTLHSVTHEMDARHGTPYHSRFLDFLRHVQSLNLVIGGAMTDPKGDRSKAPHQQPNPDAFLHVTRRTPEGVYIRGAKCHQTGCLNSHWLIVMPTMRLTEADRDYAITGALPVDAPGLTYVYGRQSCDTRALEPGTLDQGNPTYGGQEATILFDDVFIPNHHIFMDGQTDFAAMLVERFTSYHRRSYVCKSGVGDVLIGAAATIADYNGAASASHIKDKLVEMTHLNETIYATGIAASHQGTPTASGVCLPNDLLANICKHHVTQIPFTLARIAQDLAGGLVATAPSEADLNHPEIGPRLLALLQARQDIPTLDRLKILRLIENMTLGRNAVGYLTESLHGAGSPQAQRIQIARQGNLEEKKQMALRLTGMSQA